MSGIRSIHRNPTVKGSATAASAPIYVDSDDNQLKVIPAGSGTTEIIVPLATERTLTPVVAVTLTAAQSGTNVYLGPTAGFIITIPAPAAGLRYKFTVADNFATTPYVITVAGGVNVIQGGATVAGADVPAADEGEINFIESAELKGDFVDVWSDGLSWFVNGRGTTSGSITFTAA